MKSLRFLKENGVDVDSSLNLFGSVEIYNETMEDFLKGIDKKIDNLKQYKDLDEMHNYAIFAHSIKSDARYLGFKIVADVAFKHETAGKENDQHFIINNYDNLIITVNEMKNVINKYLTEEDEPLIKIVGSKLSKKTILVADDSPLITNLIDKTLNSKYNVVIAENGEEVINKLKNVDVLLLDLNMPIKNGFEVLDYLKEKNLFEDIKVSIITGDEDKLTIDKAFTYPIVDMLNKPFSIDELIRVVEKTINY